MSKKKNTLKDLDAFLKQQAATLVSPPRISATVTETLEAPEITIDRNLSPAAGLENIAPPGSKSELYDFILKSVESQHQITAEDKMLINTILYIKGGSNWKENIRSYWRNKVS